MISYKVQYNGTTYVTRNESLGDAVLDEAASHEYKNATSYGDVMLLADGKLSGAWTAACGGKALHTLSSIKDAKVEEIDGYLHITGTEGFAQIEITADKIVRNGEVLWERAALAQAVVEEETEVAQATVEEEIPAQVAEETSIPEPEEAQVVAEVEPEAETVVTDTNEHNNGGVDTVGAVEEATDTDGEAFIIGEVTTDEVAQRMTSMMTVSTTTADCNEKRVPIGLKLGKNSDNLDYEYPTFTLGIKTAEVKDPKRTNLVIGNGRWVKRTPTKPIPESTPIPAPAPVVQENSYVPPRHTVFTNSKKDGHRQGPMDTDMSIFQQPAFEPEPASVPDPEPVSAPEVAPVVEETATVVQEESKDTSGGTTASSWDEALNGFNVLESERDATIVDKTPPVAVNDLGVKQSTPVVESYDDLPEWMDLVPKALLGNLSSFLVRDIQHNIIDTEYVLKQHWDKAGQWYATDVVSSAERIFYNASDNAIYRTGFGQCKKYLRKVGNA